MIISPCGAHPFRLNVIRHNVFEIGEWVTADSASLSLLSDLPFEQLLHFCLRSEFSIAPGMMRIFNALDRGPDSPPVPYLFPATTEERIVDGAAFIATKLHGFLGW